jgi:hypothetical protein
MDIVFKLEILENLAFVIDWVPISPSLWGCIDNGSSHNLVPLEGKGWILEKLEQCYDDV